MVSFTLNFSGLFLFRPDKLKLMTSLHDIQNLVNKSDSLEKQIDQQLHVLPVTDVEDRVAAENNLVEAAKDIGLVADDIETIEQLMTELTHIEHDEVDQINSLIEQVREKESEEHHRLVNLVKTLKKEKATKSFVDQEFDELKQWIQALEELTQEIHEISEAIAIVAREIAREGDYLMELTEDEEKLLSGLASKESQYGGEEVADLYWEILDMFRKEGEQDYRLINGEEKLSESLESSIDRLSTVIGEVEGDLEELEGEVLPYINHIYAQDIPEINYLTKMTKDIEERISDAETRLEKAHEKIDRDWSSVESEAENIPAILDDLGGLPSREAERVLPPLAEAYSRDKEKAKNALVRLKTDFEGSSRPEHVKDVLSNLDRVPYYSKGETKMLSGTNAVNEFDRIRANAVDYAIVESNYRQGRFLNKSSHSELWVITMDETGTLVGQYGFYLEERTGFYHEGGHILDKHRTKSLYSWFTAKKEEGKLHV